MVTIPYLYLTMVTILVGAVAFSVCRDEKLRRSVATRAAYSEVI